MLNGDHVHACVLGTGPEKMRVKNVGAGQKERQRTKGMKVKRQHVRDPGRGYVWRKAPTETVQVRAKHVTRYYVRKREPEHITWGKTCKSPAGSRNTCINNHHNNHNSLA